MSVDDLDDLTDALIEDTVHCAVCGASCMLGGNDHVLLDGADRRLADGCNGLFCVECAAAIHRGYMDLLLRCGICEHGIDERDYCPDCNAEYKRSRIANGLDGDDL